MSQLEKHCTFSNLKSGAGLTVKNDRSSSSSPDLFESDTVISISDSDVEESAPSLSSDSSDLPNFSPSDDLGRESLFDEKMYLLVWLADIRRKFSMINELYKAEQVRQPKMITEIKRKNASNLDNMHRHLDEMHCHVKRRNEKGRTSFIVLFDLYSLMRSRDSCIFMEPAIAGKLIQLLDDWINGSSFKFGNFDRIRSFLRARFAAKGDDLRCLILAWKKSQFFSYDKLIKMRSDQMYVRGLYFDLLTDQVNTILYKNISYLPSLLEVGQFSTKFFHEYLTKFEIPFAGPYKRVLNNGDLRIEYFVSSANTADCFANARIPLYGIYEFRLTSIDLTPEQAVKYVNDLPIIPIWLTHVPPLFNRSLEFIRKQISV